jgi:hypothetical protein
MQQESAEAIVEVAARVAEFAPGEGTFYATLFLAASAGTLIRTLRDSRRYSARSILGRCLTGGLIGCGAIGIWIGTTHHISASGYFYALASALIGFFNEELQERALNPLIDLALGKVERLLGGGNGKRPTERGKRDADSNGQAD